MAGKVYFLHRGVASARQQGGSSPARPAFDIESRLRDDRPDLIECLRQRERTTGERIADALASPRFLTFYIGFVAGCFVTVALAAVWAGVAL